MNKWEYILWIFIVCFGSANNPAWAALKPGTIQFSNTSYNVNENAGSVDIEVARIGGSDGEVSVSYVMLDGNASKGKDYEESRGTLHWSHGETNRQFVTVKIVDNEVEDGDKTFSIVLLDETGMPSTQTMIIIKDDDAVCVLKTENGIREVSIKRQYSLQFVEIKPTNSVINIALRKAQARKFYRKAKRMFPKMSLYPFIFRAVSENAVHKDISKFWIQKEPINSELYKAIIHDGSSDSVSYEDARKVIGTVNEWCQGKAKFELPTEEQFVYLARTFYNPVKTGQLKYCRTLREEYNSDKGIKVNKVLGYQWQLTSSKCQPFDSDPIIDCDEQMYVKKGGSIESIDATECMPEYRAESSPDIREKKTTFRLVLAEFKEKDTQELAQVKAKIEKLTNELVLEQAMDQHIGQSSGHKLMVVSLSNSRNLMSKAHVIQDSFIEVLSELKENNSKTQFTLLTIGSGRKLYSLLTDQELQSLPIEGEESLLSRIEMTMNFGASDLRALADLSLVDNILQEQASIGHILYLTDNTRMSENPQEIPSQQRGVPLVWHKDGIALTVLTIKACQVWEYMEAKCVIWQNETDLTRELNTFLHQGD